MRPAAIGQPRSVRALALAIILALVVGAFIAPVVQAGLSREAKSALSDLKKLAKGKRSTTEELLAAVATLAQYAGEEGAPLEFTETLVDDILPELADEHPDKPAVMSAIAAMIGSFASDPATNEYLNENVFNDKIPGSVRGAVAGAILAESSWEWDEAFIKACLDDGASAMRLHALAKWESMSERPDGLYASLVPCMQDDEFAVRALAVKIAGPYVRASYNAAASGDVEKRAIAADRLKDLLTAAQKDEGRVRGDIIAVLEDITGNKGMPLEAWPSWLSAYREGNAGREGGNRSSGWDYYGIQSYSKKVIFIIDASISMDEALSAELIDKLKAENESKNLDWDSITNRWDLAQAELIRAINALPSVDRRKEEDEAAAVDVEFTVVCYASAVDVWEPVLKLANDENKANAIGWIQKQFPSNLTNIYGALSAAFDVAEGKGSSGAVITGKASTVDTIFFLTDGFATEGEYKMDQSLQGDARTRQYQGEMRKMCDAVQERNKLLQIQINTIGIGRHDDRTLKRLASDSGGEYVSLGE